MLSRPELAALGTLLAKMLDPTPARRPNLAEVRRGLWECAKSMQQVAWPVLARERWQSAELFLEDLAAASEESAEQFVIEVA
jgi:hypothetical protein